MQSRWIASGVALLVATYAPRAQAQTTLNWPTNLEQAVAQAQRESRPLLLWTTRSTRDNDYDSDRADRRYAAQKAALQDPAVVATAQPFVTCRMDVVRYAEDAKKFGVKAFQIVTASYDGEKLREISTPDARDAAAIVASLREAYSEFGARLYPRQAQPILTDAQATPPRIREALELVARFRVTAADHDVATLLERERLDPSVQQDAWKTLATLSTPTAVDALFDAADKNPQAAAALARCDRSAAGALLEHLEGDDTGDQQLAYKTLVKLFKINNPKGDRFWKTAPQDQIAGEQKRVRDAVGTVPAPAARDKTKKSGGKKKKKRNTP